MNIITALFIANLQLAYSLSLNPSEHLDYAGFHCVKDILNSALDVSVLVAHVDDKNIDQLFIKLQVQYYIFNVHNIEISSLDLHVYMHKHDINLLIIHNVEELKEILNKIHLNVRAKYIILNFGRNDSEKIFQIVWAKYIINVDVLWTQDGTTYIHTFFPYQNKSCGKNITVSNLGTCYNFTLDEMFPKKIPFDLHGCEIKVVANIGDPYVMDANLTTENAPEVGIEAAVLRNILRKMNLTQKLVTTTYLAFSYRYPNGTVIGTHEYLSKGECDLVYGQKWNAIFLSEVFDNTYVHYTDSFTWHVPAALPGPQWINIFLTFEFGLWMCLLILLLFIILVVWIFGRLCLCEEANYSSFSQTSLNIFYMLLLGSTRLPQNISLRILIYVWSVFALILATSYQSQLLSFLMKPIFEKQVSNVDELLNSPLKILLVPNIAQSLQQSEIPSDLAILKKGHMIPLKDMTDISMKPGKGIAFFGGVCRTKYVMRKLYTSPDGKPKVYMFKHPFHAVTLTMHTVRGFPLLDRMNDIIFRSMAAGFHAKWMNDIEAPKIVVQSELRPLRTSDFIGAYIILASGYLFAILSYMLELKIFVNNN